MDVDDSFDLLFKKCTPKTAPIILPLVRKCVLESQNDTEILQALEIGFDFCLEKLSVGKFEADLFLNILQAAKKLIENKVKSIEENPTDYAQGLSVSLQIMSFFIRVYEALGKSEVVSIIEANNFLTATSEIVLSCLLHCKISEQVYGSLFSSSAEQLSNFFKAACNLLDHLLNFLTTRTRSDDEEEILLLENVMNLLVKSGFVLMNLEIKTMAKVWKTYAFILEKFSKFRERHKADETVKTLCGHITTNMEAILSEDNQDLEKTIKLNCFLLKLVIKLSTLYIGMLQTCHTAFLKLLMMLCRWDVFIKTQPKFRSKEIQDLINQLTIAAEPLLLPLMGYEGFINVLDDKLHCDKKSIELPVLSCLIMKKLLDSDSVTRHLWFNKDRNILEWVLSYASSSLFISHPVSLPNIVINGEEKKFTDLYEYVLVSTSAFLMTSTAKEYYLVEKTLIKSIMQADPIRALLAIDIWCLLARFADSELCLSQIFTLSELFQEFNIGTLRSEKWYLSSLIRRLFLLLSENGRKMFLDSFESSFYSLLWEECNFNGLTTAESSYIRGCVLRRIECMLDGAEVKSCKPEQGTSRQSELELKFKSRILRLWKFNCDVFAFNFENERFMKILCGLTVSVVSNLSPEDLFLVLTQIKKLLIITQATCFKLHFTKILKSLSTVFIPRGDFQKKILTTIAEIFRILLSSKQVFAKQKAFNTFYTFSHVTAHAEVISLTVQDAPDLKEEVMKYFKQKPSELTDFNISDYFNDLYETKYQHACMEVKALTKNLKQDPIEWEKTVIRWKEDMKSISEHFELLSEPDKKEIRSICQSLLDRRNL